MIFNRLKGDGTRAAVEFVEIASFERARRRASFGAFRKIKLRRPILVQTKRLAGAPVRGFKVVERTWWWVTSIGSDCLVGRSEAGQSSIIAYEDVMAVGRADSSYDSRGT